MPLRTVLLLAALIAGTASAALGQADTARTAEKEPNRLIGEKSPYLLQHAFNPVDWYPWGEEAFEKARAEDKPIFLSIGYSTCHWCHVMERESFADPEIAARMNERFVNVKVDREERPDVDRVYLAATRAMTGEGGWPMSVFLTHDLEPFFAGTYFPPQTEGGRPGFSDVLEAVHEAWTSDRARVRQTAGEITAFLEERTSAEAGDAEWPGRPGEAAFSAFAAQYDSLHGGFGTAPKFPRPAALGFLLRYGHGDGRPRATAMAARTLGQVAQGGLRDHVGGGFHRYAVDRRWRVPHFEKMLYDQAGLAVALLEAYQLTGDSALADVARSTLDFVLREMTGPEGGFYSALGADSPLPEDPGKQGEGAFYVWAEREVDRLLPPDVAGVFKARYGIEAGGNVPAEADPEGELGGQNILYVALPVDTLAARLGRTSADVRQALEAARQRLFEVRAGRPRPNLDDKVLTSWSGLMVSAMAKGYAAFGDVRYREAAERAARFILATLYDEGTGTLLRRYRDGEAGLEAHLEDYAFIVQGLLDLYEAAPDVRWLTSALELTETQIEQFWDAEAGGFFETSEANPDVLVRLKEAYDGDMPSANAVAAMNLLRLAQMTDRDDWREKAEATVRAFAGPIRTSPTALPALLAAHDFSRTPTKQVVIAGRPESADVRRMLRAVHRRFSPNKVVLLADGGRGQARLAELLPFIEGVRMKDGQATAYVCEDYVCQQPTTDVEVMARLLGE